MWVSITTMFRMLRKLNLSLKKTLHPDEKESEQVQQARFEYWQSIRTIPAHELVFIAESGVDLGLTRLSARSVKGRRAYGKRPSRRGRRVSMLSAISLKAVLTNGNVMGTTDSLTFEAFIAQQLVPQLWAGTCVILDNCSIHKS